MNADEEIMALFIDESKQIMDELEPLILKLEKSPTDEEIINSLFRNIHSLKGASGAMSGGDFLYRLGHEWESFLSLIRKNECSVKKEAIDLFLLSIDLCNESLKVIAGNPYRDSLDQEIQQAVELYRILITNKGEMGGQSQALATAKNNSSDETIELDDSGVWVSNEKLESFFSLTGELIVLKNYFHVLSQDQELKKDVKRFEQKLNEVYFTLDKITDTTQREVMGLRKIPINKVLAKIPRIVRQVSDTVAKTVNYELIGGDISIDKSLTGAISSCIVHMIRNSIDHGIESTIERAQAGKEETGQIQVIVTESSEKFFIEINDDGSGIDRETLIAKSIEKGILSADRAKELDGQEAYQLIFEPGLSTAEYVTDISGRGVGMDAVKQSITNLGGQVFIESTPGKGTKIFFEVPVPRTVQVEETVLAKTRDLYLALPLSHIIEIIPMRDVATNLIEGRILGQFRGRSVPLFKHPSQDGSTTKAPFTAEGGSVVFLHSKGSNIGLHVDSIHDQLEAVVQPFNTLFGSFDGFKGTTVLNDEDIAYVIEVEDYINTYLKVS